MSDLPPNKITKNLVNVIDITDDIEYIDFVKKPGYMVIGFKNKQTIIYEYNAII